MLEDWFNTHKSIVPSIALLKDIYNIEDIENLYNQQNKIGMKMIFTMH